MWDEHADPFTNTVRVTVGTLRRKLSEDGEDQLIETVVGRGLPAPPAGAPREPRAAVARPTASPWTARPAGARSSGSPAACPTGWARSASASPPSTRCSSSGWPPSWSAASTSRSPPASHDEPVSRDQDMELVIRQLPPHRGWPTSARCDVPGLRAAGERAVAPAAAQLLVRRPRPAVPRQPRRRLGRRRPGARPDRPHHRRGPRHPGHRPVPAHRAPGPARRAEGPGRHLRRHAGAPRRGVREPAPLHPGGVARAAQPARGDPHQPRRRAGRRATPSTEDLRRTAEVVRPHGRADVAPRRRPADLRPPGCDRACSSSGSTSPRWSPTRPPSSRCRPRRAGSRWCRPPTPGLVGRRRPRRPAPGARQPARQRGPAGAEGSTIRVAAGREGSERPQRPVGLDRGRGPGPGHPRGPARARVPALLAGRRAPGPRGGPQRPGPDHRAPDRREPPRVDPAGRQRRRAARPSRCGCPAAPSSPNGSP